MVKSLLRFRFPLLFLAFIFVSGCYTQFSTVKKTTKKHYKSPQDEMVYEEEYQEQAETGYVEEEENPTVYQYNFYNYDPFAYDFYFSPYYRGFSISFGYDPWFYDPWFYDPFAVSFYYGSWYSPFWHYWPPHRYWSFYYGYRTGYWDGYYGFASPYYGAYDPYWGYVYSPFGRSIAEKLQKRRDFGYRRGLATSTGVTSTPPYLTKVATGNKPVSRVERIRKAHTGDRSQVPGRVSTRRTRKTTREGVRALSSRPVRKLSSKGRISRAPTRIRSRRIAPAPSTNRKAISPKRTRKRIPNISSQRTRHLPKKSKSPRTVRRKRTTKVISSGASRSANSSRTRSRGTSYKPRTNRTSRSVAVPSTSRSSSSSRSKSSSSRRTRKK